MAKEEPKQQKSVKRLSATLPLPLAEFVGRITGEGKLHKTPGEYIRDLVRRDMERHIERKEIDDLLESTFSPCNTSSPWTKADLDELRKKAHK